jgi:hypothetical protein
VLELVNVVPVFQEEDDQPAHVRAVDEEVGSEGVTAGDNVMILKNIFAETLWCRLSEYLHTYFTMRMSTLQGPLLTAPQGLDDLLGV